MDVLKLPATGGFSVKASAREVGQKRLKRVRHWHSKPVFGQVLRRDSLVLQLTSCIETFMSREPTEGELPTVVAIHQNTAHDLLNDQLQHLLGLLYYDPDLNLSAATCALHGIAVDLKARLDKYLQYPYKFVWRCAASGFQLLSGAQSLLFERTI